MSKKRNGKSIRSKIVFGYVKIYILISFVLLIVLVCTAYIAGFYVMQDYVDDDLRSVLNKLPEYGEISNEELYALTDDLMPSYVARYDLLYEFERVKLEDIKSHYSYAEMQNSNNSKPQINLSTQAPMPTPIPTAAETYMSTQTPTPPPQATGTAITVNDIETIKGFVTSTVLNLRLGPGTENQPVYVLRYGDELRIIKTNYHDNWHQILYNGQELYVSGRYVVISDIAPTPTPNEYSEFWRNTQNTQEHLFSKSGLQSYTTNSFDYNQHYNAIVNIKEISKLYIIQNSTVKLTEQDEFGIEEKYILQAVADVSKLIKLSTLYSGLAITLVAFILFFILGLLLVAIYGAYKTRKYLKPISDITKLAAEIEPNSEYRINVNSAQFELQELVITINDMLDRLNAAHVKRRKFVSDVSHELRTPISVIAGYANMLKRWASDDRKVFDESVDAIIDESANMKYLVENLLFLARSDNEQNLYDMEAFDISNLVESIYKDAKMVDSNRHEIILESAQGIIVNGDRNRLKQAIREFVQNAMKYTPPTGEIKISLQTEGKHAIINITDTGIGISKKDMGHIFSRFYRGDVSRNRENGGYGLGLSISREIISAHDGKITFKSKENSGTDVTIILNVM